MSDVDSEAPSPTAAIADRRSVPPSPDAPLSAVTFLASFLLAISSVIHLLLWSERDTDPVRPLFVLLGVAAALLSMALLRLRTRNVLLAGVAFMAAVTVVMAVGSVAGTGYHESLPSPYAQSAVYVHGIASVLMAAAALLARPGRATELPSRLDPEPEDGEADVTEDSGFEPAALAPAPHQAEPKLIRWPADRPHPVEIGAEAGLPQRVRPEVEPGVPFLMKLLARRKAIGSASSTTPAASEALLTPAAESETSADHEPVSLSWPPRRAAAVSPEHGAAPPEPPPPLPEPAAESPDASAESQTDETVAGPAALTVEAESAATPDVEEEAEEPESGVSVAAYEPIPDSTPEPLRTLLIREQHVLGQLEHAFGPNDPGVINTRSNLAYYLVSAGLYSRAVVLQESVAADTERILGKTHPHALTARSRLVQWRKLAKKRRRSQVSIAG